MSSERYTFDKFSHHPAITSFTGSSIEGQCHPWGIRGNTSSDYNIPRSWCERDICAHVLYMFSSACELSIILCKWERVNAEICLPLVCKRVSYTFLLHFSVKSLGWMSHHAQVNDPFPLLVLHEMFYLLCQNRVVFITTFSPKNIVFSSNLASFFLLLASSFLLWAHSSGSVGFFPADPVLCRWAEICLHKYYWVPCK